MAYLSCRSCREKIWRPGTGASNPLCYSCLEKQRDELLALLKKMEWELTTDWISVECCRSCHELRKSGHTPDCELASLLKKFTPESA